VMLMAGRAGACLDRSGGLAGHEDESIGLPRRPRAVSPRTFPQAKVSANADFRLWKS
jgi:hypothetical protein